MPTDTNSSSNDELFDFLSNGLPAERVAKIIRVLPSWISSSGPFRDFIETYRDKVHSKLRNPDSPEAFDDMFYEIFVAFQLLSNFGNLINSMEYEKYGDKTGPDFTICFVNGFRFNVEVKRIIEYPIELALSGLISFLDNELRGSLIGISIAVSLNKFDKNDLLVSAKLRDRQFQTDALNFIRSSLKDFKLGDRRSQKIYTYCSLISVRIQKSDSNGLCFNAFTTDPIPYYNEAKDKIALRIKDALRQIVANEPNLIIIGSPNICYDESNFWAAMKLLPNEFDTNSKFRFVSTVLFKCLWGNRNCIWLNENAEMPFPEHVLSQFPRLFQSNS